MICHRLPCCPQPFSELQGCVLFAEVLPHPHSPLLNCVIIFKQINSIAEFSRPNDEFAVRIPLISLSPENQLMDDTQCFLGEALKQPCMSPKLPETLPRPTLSCCLQLGLRSGAKGDPSPSLAGRNVIAGPCSCDTRLIDSDPRPDLESKRSLEVEAGSSTIQSTFS